MTILNEIENFDKAVQAMTECGENKSEANRKMNRLVSTVNQKIETLILKALNTEIDDTEKDLLKNGIEIAKNYRNLFGYSETD
jgi:hypothetical protein